MIRISPFSTQTNNDGTTDYNFRNENDIFRYIHYVLKGNIHIQPIYAGTRGLRSHASNPAAVAEDMINIQILHNKLSGLRIRGLILSISKDELTLPLASQQIAIIAEQFSDYIFFSGFQTAYGIFDRGNCFEIHYAINTVCFVNGAKFRQNHTDILADEQLCAETVVAEVTGKIIPCTFDFDSLEYA